MGSSKTISSSATTLVSAAAGAAPRRAVVLNSLGVLALLLLLLSLSAVGTVQCGSHSPQPPPGLSPDFYKKSCPQLFSIVYNGVKNATLSDVRITASLLRVSFHDCWIGGCDASLSLDNDTALNITSEQFSAPNNNSIRGFPVLDAIKAQLEAVCPKTVSCADLITVAARDSVVLAGGLGWPVVLGRRDSLTSHFNQSNSRDRDGLPSPFDPLNGTIANFANRSFSADEMITLSGAHTFGRAHCSVTTPRFTDSPPLDLNDTATAAPALKAELLKSCANGTLNTSIVNNLDMTTPNTFDNKYYLNLEKHFGVLHTDQNLFSAPGANTALVKLFGQKQQTFLKAFAKAMIKMQNLGPLTGTEGQIRLQCGKVNPPDITSSSWTSLEEEALIAAE